jgi:hypothetical protein
MNLQKYNNIKESEFKHIPEISCYNHNYYIGLKDKTTHDLLYAESDDDNYTEWFILIDDKFVLFAESFTNKGDVLSLI